MEHKTRVEKVNISPGGELLVYRAFCDCGWSQSGLLTPLKKDASAAAKAHMEEVA